VESVVSNPDRPNTVAHAPIELDWVADLNFEAGKAGGPKVRIDGDGTSGPSPFDAFLATIAACSSTDVVTILQKQRTPVEALHVRVDARRIDAVPRRLASAVLHFRIRAPGATTPKVARAVELAVTKYCSVRSSLIADAPVTWTIELEG
jgi:putative redox protein